MHSGLLKRSWVKFNGLHHSKTLQFNPHEKDAHVFLNKGIWLRGSCVYFLWRRGSCKSAIVVVVRGPMRHYKLNQPHRPLAAKDLCIVAEDKDKQVRWNTINGTEFALQMGFEEKSTEAEMFRNQIDFPQKRRDKRKFINRIGLIEEEVGLHQVTESKSRIIIQLHS